MNYYEKRFYIRGCQKFLRPLRSQAGPSGILRKSRLDKLIAHADFEHVRAVFELGFGTGKLAQQLLERYLPPDAIYSGIHISATMARLKTPIAKAARTALRKKFVLTESLFA